MLLEVSLDCFLLPPIWLIRDTEPTLAGDLIKSLFQSQHNEKVHQISQQEQLAQFCQHSRLYKPPLLKQQTHVGSPCYKCDILLIALQALAASSSPCITI
jgi:hypothetical protein